MLDPFAAHTPSMIGPIENGFPVTPSDSTPLIQVTRALWVGTDGDVSVITRGNDTITLAGVKAGTLIPIRVTHVRFTGTTASSIVALY